MEMGEEGRTAKIPPTQIPAMVNENHRLLSLFQENKVKTAERGRGLGFSIVRVPGEKQGGVVSGFLVS